MIKELIDDLKENYLKILYEKIKNKYIVYFSRLWNKEYAILKVDCNFEEFKENMNAELDGLIINNNPKFTVIDAPYYANYIGPAQVYLRCAEIFDDEDSAMLYYEMNK